VLATPPISQSRMEGLVCVRVAHGLCGSGSSVVWRRVELRAYPARTHSARYICAMRRYNMCHMCVECCVWLP
jgi:hypothetical protein